MTVADAAAAEAWLGEPVSDGGLMMRDARVVRPAAVLEAWLDGDFDLILMDMQMPVLNGIDATRAIRLREAEEARRRIPIIALTANALAEDRDACLAAGMDDFIAKPFRADAMLAVIRKFLA